MKFGWIITLGLIGVILLGTGANLFIKQRLFLQRAEPATAIVTENKRYKYTGQVNEYGVQHYYCSEFQFQTKDGSSVSFEEPDCAQLDSPPDYEIGQTVNAYYDPADPGKTVQMQKDQYADAEAGTVSGVLSMLLALGLYWNGRRKSRMATVAKAKGKPI